MRGNGLAGMRTTFFDTVNCLLTDFLVRYPYNEHALECQIYLRESITAKRYDDTGVQAMIKPEQGVQADL